jgi:CRISPR-associated protein Csd1
MKAYHLRNNRCRGGNVMTEQLKPALNENHPHPAYQCGRLMAVLARLQRSALGDVGAGLVQRFYAAASSTPSLVLGRITRLSQFHLSKLDPGLAHWYEGQIAGVWGQIQGPLPRTLDLEGQSLFALGYYQQIAHMRSTRSDKADNDKGETNE